MRYLITIVAIVIALIPLGVSASPPTTEDYYMLGIKLIYEMDTPEEYRQFANFLDDALTNMADGKEIYAAMMNLVNKTGKAQGLKQHAEDIIINIFAEHFKQGDKG